MISTRESLVGRIKSKGTLKGNINNSIVKVYPAVEDLVVTPTTEEQVFKSDNCNYGEVRVLGDSELNASNIKKDVEIFGVVGNLEEMTTETKEGINNQEEIIANQETTLEEINQVIQDKILVKEKFKPRYMSQPIKFQNYTGTELNNEVSMLDTTYFTDFSQMFKNCQAITELDLSGFDTRNATTLFSMFHNCTSLIELDLSNFDTSNVTSLQTMFNMAYKLTKVNLSSFDTSKVTNMNSVFFGCSKLKHIDIRNFTFDKVTNSTSMFDGIPKDCLIIVKGETEKEWVLNVRSALTNVKTIAELEG